ncbi:response regulator transcription factor [Cryptosporangium sp. NPDC051539]|uniref:response regulator transcription factor n=1 Tax=Cryptosporangium sp. NPDC051539 TaxID=3363962 RepID=UPI0037B10661
MSTESAPQRVLVVDDDPTVSEVVGRYLRRAGFVVDQAADGPGALRAAAKHPPDLVVLDLMLPGLSGLEVCRRLRAGSDVPIVMLTALGDETDRVVGFEIGADDYVTKPFSPRELTLRAQSILRRVNRGDGAQTLLSDGGLRLDPGSREVSLHGSPVPLTLREFDLLAHFLRHPGRAFNRAELLRQVWGWDVGDQATVTVHVRRLREKIEPDPTCPSRIQTVWGVGYRYHRSESDA